MPNRLESAASPYLRSHATNPVHWWEWSAEAFAEAQRRDVPVLVSIGYSTCHWCHVMARESFSDPVLAAYLNDNFVAIKVDREEHAEVDSTYLAAASAFTPNLGWPLNVFVTPAGRAFFAGTYWPPTAVGQHPAFRQVLESVTEAWTARREQVETSGAAIAQALAQSRGVESELVTDFADVIDALAAAEDLEHGGFGDAPKFPVTPVLRFLLDRGARSAEHSPEAAGLADRTLKAMAASALRDPVDGGFFRYSTQADWTDPHYERMLYDNAQLLATYALADSAEIATGVAEFLRDRLLLPSGAFASGLDSESTVDGKRVEGFYYSLDAASRARVEAPPRDDKILTGWNGLAIEALALAGARFGNAEWIALARGAADFLLAEHVGRAGSGADDGTGSGAGADDGSTATAVAGVAGERLVRTSIDGILSDAAATLEDSGMLAQGLLELSIATGEVRYAIAARDLIDGALAAGAAGSGSSPFGLPGGSDSVLAAQGLSTEADISDGAHPSGLSAMAAAAHTLFALTGDAQYRDAAEASMKLVGQLAAQQPISFGTALTLMSELGAPLRQLVVVAGDEVNGELTSLARTLHRAGGIGVAVSQAQGDAFAASGFELFAARTATGGQPTAYLCEEFVCRLPLTDVAALTALLSTN
ncbi:thioredoxin domain-containing protein [Salinibacterium sp. SWN1162]|uniref:thioredoxin domain-containing protein n=1 Tax=Salinibacterium sp. SWN1162 TaxID=2792053 RepID=UPI0018CDD8AF|nr:thioredoxin domain-containing protein [Salinibacterium sp. SWN1162]MBH0010221.1 thioredoxin domain-containing protein [Salinibacterium sp. SWN1162]